MRLPIQPLGAVLVVALAAAALAADGGVDASTPAIWESCAEPDAGDVAVEMDGGWVALSPARASYDACRVASCASYLESAPAGAQAADGGFQWLTSHTVTAALGLVSTVLGIIEADRAAHGHVP